MVLNRGRQPWRILHIGLIGLLNRYVFGPSDTRLLVGPFGASSVPLGVLLLLAVVLVFNNVTATRSYPANRHWYKL